MTDGAQRENLGIIVQYKVKVRLTMAGALGGELTAELPFTLTHPKPVESPRPQSRPQTAVSASAIDPDLIQFDTRPVKYLSPA